ncbi:MAG: RnfABCDGE type electron transport complex subunit D [Chloroflexi bacterium]|nr:RnfABCDGE type electron transport complex subunit D [Chloroflexota bacterium]
MKPSTVVRYFRTPKGLLLLVLAVLTAVAYPVDGFAAVVRMLAAGAMAAGVDLLFMSRRNKIELPDSALLTGFITAMVMSQTAPLYAPMLAAGVAIASKHLIRTASGHIFNPAALGLLVTALLLSSEQSWWGGLGDQPAVYVLVLIALGALVVEKVNKWPSVVAFAAAYFGLLTVAAIFGSPLAVADAFREPMSGAAVYFALFMLTDPPTTPARPSDQAWFGIAVAVASLACVALNPTSVYYLPAGLLAGNALEAARRSLAMRRKQRGAPARTLAPERVAA